VSRLHPIAFASKRTSTTEEKYKPFLLEFAALKYAFDKFSDIVYGYPVEIETDCQALRDVLMNDKLSATHARWRDSVLAHNIIDVRHVPGVTNIADGISRQYENTEKASNDGSEYTVSPDWERQAGLTYDVYYTTLSSDNAALRERFKSEPLFLDVIDALEGIKHSKNLREQKRAQHRALHYMIEDDKLWYIAGGTRARARSRQECVTQEEATQLAREEHEKGGHWHRDNVKIALLDKIHSPKLDQSILKAILDCARCKNFGSTHLHSLLQPITRRHPFELLVGDYLSLPVGKGGFHTVGLYLDTFSQHVWGDMFKTAGSAKTTNKSIDNICNTYAPPGTFMSDGGKHFNNNEVKNNCTKWGIKLHITPAYSPWVNGLVEGTNKLLLYVLACLCAPEIGEDGWQTTEWNNLPRAWPDHFQEAINILNWRILPALKFSPKELMLGLVVNTANTPLQASTSVLTPTDVDNHLTYAAQQRLDGYAEAIHHAIRRKATFDKKVLKSKAGPVTFRKGQLVQVYRSDLMTTLSTDRKLQPMWTGPYRIHERLLNSYKLEELDGTPKAGEFSARRLRAFTPREGTELAKIQQELEERIAGEDERVEEEEVAGSESNNAVDDEEDSLEVENVDEDGDSEGEPEEEGSSIARRVVGRRGRRQKGGGWMD
jgi:transposase InsO family protein